LFDWAGAFGALGMISIGMALVVLGRLSHRLGRVTGAGSAYRGFYVAAALVWIGAAARVSNLTGSGAGSLNLHHEAFWVFLYHGAPAVGLTFGVFVAWRYWSWLLAERG
jgi:hypothetical protein